MNPAVIVTYLAGVLAMGMVVRLIPGAPALQGELGASAAQMGLVLGVIGLPGLLGPFVGAIADRIGAVQLMLISGLMAAAASLLLTVAPNTGLVLAVRILEGFAFVGMGMAAPLLLLRLTQGKAQIAAMALWATAPPAGIALAFFLAGLLGAGSWRPLFVVYAVLFAVVSIAVFFVVGRRRDEPAVGAHAPFEVAALLRAYVDAPLVRLMISYLLIAAFGLGLTTVFPQVAGRLFGLTPKFAAQLLGLANLAVIPGAALGGYLLGKTGAFRLLMAAVAGLTAVCTVVAFTPAVSSAVVAAAVFGIFFLQGVASTVLMSALPRIVPPERQGLAMGVLGQFASLAVFIAAPMWLLMWERGGSVMLAIGGAVMMAGLFLVFPAPRTRSGSVALDPANPPG